MAALTPLAKELLAGPNFAVVATTNADGTLQQTVVWAAEQDGEVVFSSLDTRAKTRNLRRDPTINVLVIDCDDSHRYCEIRGVARLETDGAAELIDQLSLAYDGRPWPEKEPRQPRTKITIAPVRVRDYA